MPILTTLRRLLSPSRTDLAHAPYLAHYQVVDRNGEVYHESDVPVVYFEDGPAIAKASLLSRVEPDRGWRVVRTYR